MARKNIDGVVRKRSQIEKTRRNVLLWVGGAATLVGVVVVVSGMVIQAGIFNQKIIGMKQDTLDQIELNIDQADDLKVDIAALNTDDNLTSVRSSEDAPGLQSVLDALPADGNKLALGASLQQKVFQLPGVSLDTLSVDSAYASSTGGENTSSSNDLLPLDFSATISGSPNDIRDALVRLESSIRSINLKYLQGNTSGGDVMVRLTGQVYYYPPVNLELGSEVVKE